MMGLRGKRMISNLTAKLGARENKGWGLPTDARNRKI
jgi:hypothetical protein